MRIADDVRLAGLVTEHLAKSAHSLSTEAAERLPRTIALVKDGAATVVQLAELCGFALSARPLTLDAKTQGLLTDETRERLTRLTNHLSQATDWTQESLTVSLKSFGEAEGVGMGKFGPALRGVLSGGAAAPDLASALAALGRDESLNRLSDALSLAQ